MQKEYLVGYTGFVGSNLMAKHSFSGMFNRKNIQEAFGGQPDLLVYSGVPAEMFLANRDPQADRKIILEAEENIQKINAKQTVLISTIAVYPHTNCVNEQTAIDIEKLQPYGRNRCELEIWVEQHCENHLIIRLPALYGLNLKKNFIYDFLHIIPSMLTESKFRELSNQEAILFKYYSPLDNGFYKCKSLMKFERQELIKCFERLGFSALNFTDSRSKYQFFDLSLLWYYIEVAIKHNINKLNIAVPPIQVKELYWELKKEKFNNILDKPPFDYDMRTCYDFMLGGSDGYLLSKEKTIQGILRFLAAQIEEMTVRE